MTSLISAPIGRDAATIVQLLHEQGIPAAACTDLHQLAGAIGPGTDFVVIAEESLRRGADALTAALQRQPPWSDIPVILLSAAGHRTSSLSRWSILRELGNVTMLERPLHKGTLQGAARAAQRARARQYVSRQHLEDLQAARDQLEQRVAERTLQLRAEIAERKAIQDALSHAQQLEALGRLTGGVAHDFNNLLQVVLSGIAVLERNMGDPERRTRVLASMRQAGQRGAAVTKQMLAFARRQPLAVETIDVGERVHGIEAVLRAALPSAIELRVTVEPGLWPVEADASQLEVALLNLCLNARDAIDGAGTIEITAANVAAKSGMSGAAAVDSVAIRVCDSGTGMDEATKLRAFDPFFTTKEVGRGTGLGLSQVYGFATQSGGSAFIDSSPRGGTIVTIQLPRATGPASTRSETSREIGVGKAKGNVLVVEDEPLVAEIAVETLRSFGLEADHSPSADQALTRNLNVYNGMVTDVIMPGSMDGLALAREARRRCPTLPILLVSGYAGDPKRIRDSGFAFLAKPYTAEELAAALARCGMLDRRTRARDEALR